MKKEREKLEGLVFKSKRYGEFKVLSYISKGIYNIEFITTKTKKIASFTNIKRGAVMDEYFPSVYNIGCLGKKYNTNHLLYGRWHNMLSRCYNIKSNDYKNYGAIDVKVCDRWLCFENYVDDVILLSGYNENSIKLKLLELDKDIISRDAKIYSSETCSWVSKGANTNEMNKRVKQKYFIATRLIDNYIEEDYNVLDFCRRWNLKASSCVNECLYGNRNEYEGWKFEYKSNPKYYIQSNKITNKSGFKGICKTTNGLKWRATASLNYKQINLGKYESLTDAIIARYEWEVKTYGNFRKNDAKDAYLKSINYISKSLYNDTDDSEELEGLNI